MSFQKISLKPEYRTRLDNVIEKFFTPALSQSILYQRAAGFFSSSALLSLENGINNLLANGGAIQLITSPRLSEEDIAAINEGLKRRENFSYAPINTFAEKNLNLLSDLIANNQLEIKIALLDDDNEIGMFHEKLGLLYDCSGNVIAFSGSMNESANAFTANYEAIDIFTSWTDDAARVRCKQAAFNAMWKNLDSGVKVLDFSAVDFELFSNRQKFGVANKKNFYNLGIKIPANIVLREYQKRAVENWEKNFYVGIFDMATGTGKTYTALAAVTKLSRTVEKIAVIIVCPYKNLVEQWAQNILKFGMTPIICHSDSEQKHWRERLKIAVKSFNFGEQENFCAVMTSATFSAKNVQDLLKTLKGNAVLVVDEAHNFGAEKLSKCLLQNVPYRLALSATIERYGDAEGTQRIYNYFGKKCIEYTLKDAIKNNMLTPYYYHPVLVSLNDEELENYLDLTAKINKNFHAGAENISEYVKILLTKRAGIVAAAQNKIVTLRKLIANYKNDNQILIYCGASKVNDMRQIDVVTKILGNEFNMRVKKFTCEEDAQEREIIKANFAEGKHLQALAAIRCLDEGIDIPSVRTAFILSSSSNYREYVQRRGRLLRKFPGKNAAVIFDFVTLPISLDEIEMYDDKIINNVKSLVKNEILRVKDFSNIAENPFDADSLISKIQRKYYMFDIKETNENLCI